jgi:hypothetical protein
MFTLLGQSRFLIASYFSIAFVFLVSDSVFLKQGWIKGAENEANVPQKTGASLIITQYETGVGQSRHMVLHLLFHGAGGLCVSEKFYNAGDIP